MRNRSSSNQQDPVVQAKGIINDFLSRYDPDAPNLVNPSPEQEKQADQEAAKEAARLLGRLGGLKGGPARAAKLSKKRRREIARKAAKIRWKKSLSNKPNLNPS